MPDPITWIMTADLPEGQTEALRALMHEMSAATRANEPDCLLYDWFITESGRACHIIERYADEAALLTHVDGFNKAYARRLFGVITPRSLTVYGAASEAVRAALAPLRPVYLSPL